MYSMDKEISQRSERMQKSTISKHNKHHGSTGHCFSFGNKAAYKITDNSSVVKYAVIKDTAIIQQYDAIFIEELIGR